jgi:circadian clock protein KaiA
MLNYLLSFKSDSSPIQVQQGQGCPVIVLAVEPALPQVSVYALLEVDSLHQALARVFEPQLDRAGDALADRYRLGLYRDLAPFLDQLETRLPDCLILQDGPNFDSLIMKLRQRSILLPVVILEANLPISEPTIYTSDFAPLRRYHSAERFIDATAIAHIDQSIDQAIAQFLRLTPPIPLTRPIDSSQSPLQAQQRRLANKLQERLRYLGVYYKRDARQFLRSLPASQAQATFAELKTLYQQIILSYFAENDSLNALIDEFVSIAFFADLSVTQVVEIHMELMDSFFKQLKLEGRSEEILVDYRLTLIDVMAHLCEMYRRSIPRES